MKIAKASRREHVDDCQHFFENLELDFGSSAPELAAIPADERNGRFKTDGEQDFDF
jgi:hypothetical protein